MYSLISILINASSLSNIYLANALANSVLPTPVGPRKIKVPIGFFGSFNPTRLRWIALPLFESLHFGPPPYSPYHPPCGEAFLFQPAPFFLPVSLSSYLQL